MAPLFCGVCGVKMMVNSAYAKIFANSIFIFV